MISFLFVLFVVSFASGGPSIFGQFESDSFQLPSFQWTLNQRTDPRAVWNNTESECCGVVRRDHWQMFGNDRVNVMAKDAGSVQFFTTDVVERWLNEIDEKSLQLGGGFSYVVEETSHTVECSAYQWAPDYALPSARRQFGIGYFRTTTTLLGGALDVEHTIFAPFGNESILYDLVRLTNVGTRSLRLSHVEFWDVNQLQLLLDWAVAGVGGEIAHVARRDLNAFFSESTSDISSDHTVLLANMNFLLNNRKKSQPPESMDTKPPGVFLIQLDSLSMTRGAFGDQSTFFGPTANASTPEALLHLASFRSNSSMLSPPTNAYAQSAMLAILSHAISLQPQQSVAMSFAYGTVPHDASHQQVLDLAAKLRQQNATALFEKSLQMWRESVMQVKLNATTFASADIIALESVWRSANVRQATTFRSYFGRSSITQGSAYLYLHGADGVPRDQSLFSMAAVYYAPDVVRQTLELLLMTQDATTGAMTYAWGNDGEVSSALGLHAWPSDLDLYLFAAVNEYLLATGDFAWLNATLPYYGSSSSAFPPGSDRSGTVLDHLRVAAMHLQVAVGVGPHGLLRIGDGDWDDGIVYALGAPLAIARTILDGESIPDSQIALAVLPTSAALLVRFDKQLAKRLNDIASPSLRQAVQSTYNNAGCYARMWAYDALGIDSVLVGGGNRSCELESQPWAVLVNDQFAGLTGDANASAAFVRRVSARLNSPIGPPIGDLVWPAVSQLWTWAVARFDADLAWRLLRQHLYDTHARVYPTSWVGVMAGPDGFGLDGFAWSSIVTPITDFPVTNANADAMFSLALLRLFGVEPASPTTSSSLAGLLIDASRLPRAALPCALTSPLLSLSIDATSVTGRYRAFNDGHVRLLVTPPSASAAQLVEFSFKKGELKTFVVQ